MPSIRQPNVKQLDVRQPDARQVNVRRPNLRQLHVSLPGCPRHLPGWLSGVGPLAIALLARSSASLCAKYQAAEVDQPRGAYQAAGDQPADGC